jgi:hypothetical protein
MAKHINPALICAKINAPYMMSLLQKPDFCAFASSWWSREVFQKLLEHVCPKDERKNLKKNETLEKIYLYGIKEQYAELKETQLALKQFETAVLSTILVKPIALSGTSQLALAWLRSRLQTGFVYAVPGDLFRVAAIASAGYEQNRDAQASIQDIIGLSNCDHLSTSVPENLQHFVFFKVVNPYPARRHVIHAYHLGPRPTRAISVVVYRNDNVKGTAVILGVQSTVSLIDLDAWAKFRFCDLVQNFYSFGQIHFGAKLAMAPSLLRAALESPVTLPPIEKSDQALTAIASYGDMLPSQRTPGYSMARSLLLNEHFASSFMQVYSY